MSRITCKSIYIRSRHACDKFASTPCLFGLMATFGRETLQLCLRTYRSQVWRAVGVVGSIPDGRTSLWYSQTRLQGLGEEASAKGSDTA